jgi:transposase
MTKKTESPCFADVFVGIDVSKAGVDVWVSPNNKGKYFTMAQLPKLVAYLQDFNPTLIVLEPTGGYEIDVLSALSGAGLPVSRPHALTMHHHAKGSGNLAKTDKLDAKKLAHYGECYQDKLALYQLPSQHSEQLRPV